MSISDFILKKKSMKPIRKRENICLQKPVVNLLAGSFSQEERQTLAELLDDRIGSDNKVHYCRLEPVPCKKDGEERFRPLWAEGLCLPQGYGLKQRRQLQEEARSLRDRLRNMAADYVNDIFNEVSTATYGHKARIRLNVLVNPEDIQAALLPELLPILKEEFGVYFPNGVHVDAYVFLDQKGYRREDSGDEKKAFSYLTLTEIEGMAREKIIQMPFMMSNYTSENCLEPFCGEERMVTAGLMMLVKDGASAEGKLKDGDTADSYDDYTFAQDCGQENGMWYSLGHFKLEVARDLIDCVVYRSLMLRMEQAAQSPEEGVKLSQMQLTEDQIDQLCADVLPISSFPPHIFYSMVKNGNVNVASMVNNTRRTVIQEVFGENLNLFYKLNCTRRYQERLEELMEVRVKKLQNAFTAMYEEEGYTLADMNVATNFILGHLEAVENECVRLKDAEQRELNRWLEERAEIANLKDVVKDTGEPRAFYQLAVQYLEKRVRGLHTEVKSEIARRYIETVQKTAQRYHGLARSVEEAERELSENIGRMIEEMTEDRLDIKCGNCVEYYTETVRKVIEEDGNFPAFIREINSRICSGELEDEQLFDEMIDYCDRRILTDSRFETDFEVEMLARLKNYKQFMTDESIYDYAFGTIMDNQKFYASYESFGTLNREVCFLVNPDNEFVSCTNKRMQNLKASRQLKVFFEKYFQDMDVLFMEGCFGIESLYNYGVYQNIWNKLESTEGAEG